MRQTRSLNGMWQFQVDPQGTLTPNTLTPDRQIPVPMPWQVVFPELQQYGGYAWYRVGFDIPHEWLGGDLRLRFGAVDYWCEVYVNGECVGEHEGGYTPFEFSIRQFAQAGQNDLVVRVYDPVQTEMSLTRWRTPHPQDTATQPPFEANNVPHGKQEWYINVGGIWQDVTLIAVPATFIDNVRITPDIYTGVAQVTVELQGVHNAAGGLQVEIFDGEACVARANTEITPGIPAYEFSLSVDQPKLWTMDTPHLYTAVVSTSTDGGADEQRIRFGYRHITTSEGQILLNGQPIFLRSALDQDIYAETIYTVPSENYLRDQFEKARIMGLNCLRCHIKPPDPIYLDLADEMGLLIWAEIPSWRTFHPKDTVHPHQLVLEDRIKARVQQTLEEMIRRDYNHPSLMIWTIVNEDWGTTLPLSPTDRAWVAQMYDTCKQLDPTRLVVDNSPCPHAWGPNVHVKSDLDDWHLYMSIPDHAKRWDQYMDQFNLRPRWTYSQHGDAQRTFKEPLILSEFGNWGLPTLSALRQHYNGQDPDWFHLGPWWSSFDGAPGWPQDVENRFNALGLNTIWKDYDDFATHSQWHQYQAMKFEIESMRRQKYLSGYVITELADIYWESNGLLDFFRQPKAYFNHFAMINSDDMLIPKLKRHAYWDDEQIELQLFGSHYSSNDWSNSHLNWHIGEQTFDTQQHAGEITRGEVKSLGRYQLTLPKLEATQMVSTEFALLDSSNMLLANNTLDVLVMPASYREAAYQGLVSVITLDNLDDQPDDFLAEPIPNDGSYSYAATTPQFDTAALAGERKVLYTLAGSMRYLGYNVTQRIRPDTKLIVTNFPTESILRWTQAGGDLLYLCKGPNAFLWAHGRSGYWITEYSWLRPGIYRRLNNVPNPLTLPFKNIAPLRTIMGLPMENPAVQNDFLAGQIAGWVHHEGVHTVQFRYGKGRVVMTTFDLEDYLPTDPAAVAMLHDLVDHLTSENCQPTLSL
jgi:hypothetical protein